VSDYVEAEGGRDAEPLESLEQLVEHFASGAKPRSEWRVGTEYEKVGVERETGRAIPFSGPRGVEVVLRRLAERFGWEPVEERGRVVALSRAGVEITLEPGGQIELSGRPFATVHEARGEIEEHLREMSAVASELGVLFLGLGIQPFSRLEEIEWVPKRRYEIMGPYMLRVGSLGQRMMKQTATVQVNLDYESEADAIEKMRVATGLGPILNAIFANSSISDGGPNGFLSFRGHIWTDTDPARCGMLRFLFEPGASFARYAEWALDAPMYFIKRAGVLHEMTGIPFRRFWREGVGGFRATIGDFALHLSTLFPEVRLKTYIELRMTDSQPEDSMLALPALAKGLLYESDAREAAWELVADLAFDERLRLQADVHRGALAARCRRYRVRELARELLAIAAESLRRQGCRDERGETEDVYLEAVRERVERGVTPAELVLEEWKRDWSHDPARLAAATAYGAGR